MSAVTFALFLLTLVTVSIWAALMALRRLVGDPRVVDRVAPFPLFLVCFTSGVIVSIADGVWTPVSIGDYGLLSLAIWATITAFIDRSTAWVTDLSAIILLVGAMLHDTSVSMFGGLFGGWLRDYQSSDLTLLIGATIAAVVLWVLCLGAFKAQMRLGRVVLTAADCVAVVLPLVAFSFSYEASITYALAACLIALAQRFKRVHTWLSEAKALREGLDDLEQNHVETTRALPAFSVFAPVTLVVAVARSVYGP